MNTLTSQEHTQSLPAISVFEDKLSKFYFPTQTHEDLGLLLSYAYALISQLGNYCVDNTNMPMFPEKIPKRVLSRGIVRMHTITDRTRDYTASDHSAIQEYISQQRDCMLLILDNSEYWDNSEYTVQPIDTEEIPRFLCLCYLLTQLLEQHFHTSQSSYIQDELRMRIKRIHKFITTSDLNMESYRDLL